MGMTENPPSAAEELRTTLMTRLAETTKRIDVLKASHAPAEGNSMPSIEAGSAPVQPSSADGLTALSESNFTVQGNETETPKLKLSRDLETNPFVLEKQRISLAFILSFDHDEVAPDDASSGSNEPYQEQDVWMFKMSNREKELATQAFTTFGFYDEYERIPGLTDAGNQHVKDTLQFVEEFKNASRFAEDDTQVESGQVLNLQDFNA